MMDDACILLFVKAPEKGRVKTRLAREMGDEFALRLHESMVLDSIDMLEQAAFPYRICYTPIGALEQMQTWLGRDKAFMPQSGNDVGERMECAFAGMFREGKKRVVITGSDIPGMNATILGQAFDALNGSDAVIGPALDGGYYLIGFTEKGFAPGVFRRLAWGTNSVFQETMGKLAQSARTVRVLPQLSDVDCRDDLKDLLGCTCGLDHAWRTLGLMRKEKLAISSIP